jgi:hypothetical protein
MMVTTKRLKWWLQINHKEHDVISLDKSKFSDYADRINPKELGIKDTTDKARIVSYHDLHPKIYNEERH